MHHLLHNPKTLTSLRIPFLLIAGWIKKLKYMVWLQFIFVLKETVLSFATT